MHSSRAVARRSDNEVRTVYCLCAALCCPPRTQVMIDVTVYCTSENASDFLDLWISTDLTGVNSATSEFKWNFISGDSTNVCPVKSQVSLVGQ